jgi:hypothetical protein
MGPEGQRAGVAVPVRAVLLLCGGRIAEGTALNRRQRYERFEPLKLAPSLANRGLSNGHGSAGTHGMDSPKNKGTGNPESKGTDNPKNKGTDNLKNKGTDIP